MFTRILTPILLGMSLPWAATYHFAADGDDARTPSQAGSPTTPWKTLAQLGTVKVMPGDSILLRRADVWHEALSIKRSGTLESPVVIAPYGSGTAMPELHGTIPLAGAPGGGPYSAKVVSGQSVKAVFTNNEPMRCARYPDTGWVKASTVEGNSALTAPGVAGQNWVGASIHLRTSVWTLETHRVLSQAGGRLVLDTKSLSTLPDSVQFFLTNHASALPFSTRPAWAYSASDSTLRWTGPAASVQAAVLPTLLDITGFNHVRASGLRLFGSTFQAVKMFGAGLHVENCNLDRPGLTGVMIKGRENRFVGNRVTAAANTAISGIGAAQTIESNIVRRTALLPDFGPDGMGDGCCGGRAIDFSADSSLIARNDIDSTGYIGIGFKGLSNLVEENVIAHSCMTTDDCAGIYSYAGKYDNAGAAGSTVRRNFVHSAVGAPPGIPKPSDASVGIYLDDGSHDIQVDSNVVWDNGKGIFLHNTQRVRLRGNIAFNNRLTQLLLAHDGLAGTGDMTGNQITDNLFVGFPGQGADPQRTIQQIQSQPLASMSGNTFCSYQIVSTKCWTETADLWNQTSLKDNDARLGPETQANGTFDNSAQGWISWPAQATFALDSGTSCRTGYCLKVAYLGGSPTTNPLFYAKKSLTVQQGQAMQLSFRARAPRAGQSLTATLRRGGGDYAVLGFLAAVSLDTNWTSHSFLFRPSESETNARIDFRNSYTDSIYWIDDISVRSVPDSLLIKRAPPVLLTNPTQATTQLGLQGSPWMDAWGTTFPASVSLQGWQGKVAFPWPGWATSIHGHATSPALRVQRLGNGWQVSGLHGPARIVDLRGRTLASLRPDSRGQASWHPSAPVRLCWLRTATETRTLIDRR
ncbi:MAG: hypothetical protein RL318_2322 [Fibrobacterota bacterium]|jgi:parallel beta-helix repeat protein